MMFDKGREGGSGFIQNSKLRSMIEKTGKRKALLFARRQDLRPRKQRVWIIVDNAGVIEQLFEADRDQERVQNVMRES